MGSLGRPGWVAGASLGLLLALGYAFQTAGLERTTVSSAGFITGLYVVFTPLLGLLLFRTTVGRAVWIGVALAVAGLAMLSGVGAGDPVGGFLGARRLSRVLAPDRADGAVRAAYDPVAFTQAEMLAAFAGFAVVTVALGQVEVPRGWTVWGALLSPASSRARWPFSSRRGRSAGRPRPRPRSRSRWSPSSRASSASGSRATASARRWAGCALIMGGILVAEPEAGRTLVGSSGGACEGGEESGLGTPQTVVGDQMTRRRRAERSRRRPRSRRRGAGP